MTSQRSNSMETAQDNIRKRVCKACDRCRLKKSKCDGSSPCSRCKADNAICVFGERKKSQDKVYPKGYVEMLEQQQGQLVAAMQKMYTLLQNGQAWPGQPLRGAQGGHPLTHDILERLDLLHPAGDSSSNYDGFEEDCNKMQQKLVERGAPYAHRRGSISSESDHGHGSSSPSSYSGTPTARSYPHNDVFARHNAPLTPPTNSPFPAQAQLAPSIKQEAPLVSQMFMNTGALDSAFTRSQWAVPPMMTDDSMDFDSAMGNFGTYSNFGANMMLLDPCDMSTSGPMMPAWNESGELDLNSL